MKKYILIIVVIFLNNKISYGQKHIEFYSSYDNFILKMSSTAKELQGKSFFIADYDDDKLISLSLIDTLGTLQNKTIFIYNDSGSLEKKLQYDANDNLILKTTYLPDNLQKAVIAKIQGVDWTPYHNDYYTKTKYDSLKNPIAHKIFSVNGELIGGIDYKFDENGMKYEGWYAGEHDTILEYSNFTFDPVDSIQSIEQYDGNDSLISRVQIRIYQ